MINKKTCGTIVFIFSALVILDSCATVKQNNITDNKSNLGSADPYQPTVPLTAGDEFHKILTAEWEKRLIENPEWATRLGDDRYNNRLNDVSFEANKKRQKDNRALHVRLKEIDRSALSEPDQLSYDLYVQKLERSNHGYRYKTYFMPIDQMGGIQIGFAGMPDYAPFDTAEDYQNYISRLRAFPKKIEQTIDLMKRGIETGWTHPKIILRLVPDQIKAQYNRPIVESPLFRPFKEFPDSFSGSRKDNFILSFNF